MNSTGPVFASEYAQISISPTKRPKEIPELIFGYDANTGTIKSLLKGDSYSEITMQAQVSLIFSKHFM